MPSAWSAACRHTGVTSLPPDAEIKPEGGRVLGVPRPASPTGMMVRSFHRAGDVENRLGFHVGQIGD